MHYEERIVMLKIKKKNKKKNLKKFNTHMNFLL